MKIRIRVFLPGLICAAALSSSAATRRSEPTSHLTGCIGCPTGMVAWWPGEGDARDLIGTERSTLVGLPGFADGIVGRAFSFNGLNDEVMNSTPGLTNIADSFTMEFWAWPTAGRDTTPETSSLGWGTGNQRYAIFPDWGGDDAAGAGVSVGTNGVSVFEHGNCYLPALLVYDTPVMGWTHIAVVYDSKQPKLFLNGVLVRAGLVSPRSFVYPSTWLGGRELDAGNYGHYRGLLDEISIYDRALSANEIAAIYAAGAAGKCQIAARSLTQTSDKSSGEGARLATPSRLVEKMGDRRGPLAATRAPANGTVAYNASAGASQIVPLERDKAFGYALPEVIGLTHLIEASTELVHWSPATNVVLYFKDLESTNFNQRFYRFSAK